MSPNFKQVELLKLNFMGFSPSDVFFQAERPSKLSSAGALGGAYDASSDPLFGSRWRQPPCYFHHRSLRRLDLRRSTFHRK